MSSDSTELSAFRFDRNGVIASAAKLVAELTRRQDEEGMPIGWQQWYAIDGPEEEEWRAAYGLEPDSGAYGIDQFIGESRLHGQGLGSAQVRVVSDWLLGPDGPGAAFVVTDPIVENERAVRAYEKAGFVKVRVLPAHETLDGVKRDSWLMEKRKPT